MAMARIIKCKALENLRRHNRNTALDIKMFSIEEMRFQIHLKNLDEVLFANTHVLDLTLVMFLFLSKEM